MGRVGALLIWGIYVGYMLLITLHLHNQRPLWNDEVCVLNNIVQLSAYDLFHRSLISDQAFPRLYLWLIQHWSMAFNYEPWSLRLLPFVCMAGAFILWMRIGISIWNNKIDRFNFALCWTASIPLIYYAAELKQYSMDVLVTAILVSLMLNVSKHHISAWWICLFPLLGLFSYPVYFLMFIPVILLWSQRKIMMVYGVVCALMVIYLWYVDARHSASSLLEIYWHDYFISFKSVEEFFKTFGEGMNNLISRWFVETPKIFRSIARGFVGLGLVYVIWQGIGALKSKPVKVNVTLIALLILLELIILGGLRIFPFTVVRLSLFFAPLLLFCMVDMFAFLRFRLPKLYWLVQILLWFYLGTMSVGISQLILKGDLGAQSVIW